MRDEAQLRRTLEEHLESALAIADGLKRGRDRLRDRNGLGSPASRQCRSAGEGQALMFKYFARPDPQVAADADALIAGFGEGAYEEARRRSIDEQRGAILDANRGKGHWDRVRREIGRRAGRDQNRVDTATRWIER